MQHVKDEIRCCHTILLRRTLLLRCGYVVSCYWFYPYKRFSNIKVLLPTSPLSFWCHKVLCCNIIVDRDLKHNFTPSLEWIKMGFSPSKLESHDKSNFECALPSAIPNFEPQCVTIQMSSIHCTYFWLPFLDRVLTGCNVSSNL
jgi:hypothetical protein